jgi:pimeloyl-ACP methyl ester carboxylesterase
VVPGPAGREIGIAEYGDPAGFPVFYFHGWPGSRLEPQFLHDSALRLRVRLIGVDRAGYGLSTYSAGSRFVLGASDVAAVADTLRIERFAVLGMSGGGPHALACAAHLGERVTATVIMAGLGALWRPGTTNGMSRVRRYGGALLRRRPSLSAPLIYMSLSWLRRRPESSLRSSLESLPPSDRATLEAPGVFDALVGSFREGLRPGVRGATRDLRTYFEPWDFSPARISGRVIFFHGTADTVVPHGSSSHLASEIPGAELVLMEDEGHYSLPLQHGHDILRALTAPL